MPVDGLDMLYTCRKYFGVADGAFLYTDAKLDRELPQDESFERMHFLLGRYERSANEFYSEYVLNNKLFATEPVKRMSRLTENLLHGIDYDAVAKRRQENFEFLEENYAYFPVVFDGYKYTRNEIFEMLSEQGITARKYFYPLTNSFECYRNYPTAGTEKTSVAQHLALRVLTLPLYADLALEDVDRICDVILGQKA